MLAVRLNVHDGGVTTETSAMPRRRRGRGVPSVGLHVAVPAQTRTEVNEVADALGITSGRYVEILVARDRAVVDPTGRPAWVREGST